MLQEEQGHPYLGTETSVCIPNAIRLNVAIRRSRVCIHGRGAFHQLREQRTLRSRRNS
jgi:hypothetical protein